MAEQLDRVGSAGEGGWVDPSEESFVGRLRHGT
jgi:hypothetical protein